LKELINGLLQFVSDNRRSLSYRASVVIIFTTVGLILNNELGFSFNYRMNSKIEELTKLNSLIDNPLSDSITKANATIWRYELLNKKSWLDYLFLRNPSANLKSPTINKDIQIPTAKSSILNYFLFYLSSGFLFYALAILFVILSVFYGVKKAPFTIRLGVAILSFSSCCLVAVLLTVLLLKIPMLGKSWGLNYVFNAVVQIIVFIWMMYIVNHFVTKSDRYLELKGESTGERPKYPFV
jgi:hypothetical protein